ncbi:tRNA dihydrouridine synthase DusB [Desulfopila sp. IMCC35006]|uniref:tRNA dihydrouridine synthase DusB n=1 Tax=Desulfopila sp. IMCC35006 TaxID=2569542 RepID=UPI0010AD53F1|nr:tRNA dihydrouridine synthase DusB [Desulfopila sp. IMCC35006]TKB27603.1 tRNA dihydrouridine synthase DusB [Desulfopila sp. IMCC35006]
MLRIGKLAFDSPFVLAPLAGYTDLPFRLLCRSFGAGYCVSEMISCHGLVYRQANTLRMLASIAEEKPVAFQLFGADPEAMADAAEILAAYNPDMLDINMGCPVRKVTRKGAGAALMTDLRLAESILAKVVARVSLPITVKIRSGKDSQSINAPAFARMLEDTGASAITVHARTWSQAFSGTIDQAIISRVKQAVAIPVIGNGDILSSADGRQMMEETGCDGVMIGRGALGNPWVFQESGRPSEVREIMAVAGRHLALIEKFLPAERVLGYIKNHMCRYFKGLPGSSTLRQKVLAAPDLPALKRQLDPDFL